MVLANIKLVKTYDSVWDFTKQNLEKVKKLFKDEIKDLKIKEYETEAEAISEYLINHGICDEDVINQVLEKDKKKWWVKYVDDSNYGYFEIYEVLD